MRRLTWLLLIVAGGCGGSEKDHADDHNKGEAGATSELSGVTGLKHKRRDWTSSKGDEDEKDRDESGTGKFGKTKSDKGESNKEDASGGGRTNQPRKQDEDSGGADKSPSSIDSQTESANPSSSTSLANPCPIST